MAEKKEFKYKGITFTPEGNIRSVDTPEGQAIIQQAQKTVPQPEKVTPPEMKVPQAPPEIKGASATPAQPGVTVTDLNQPTMNILNEQETQGQMVAQEFENLANSVNLGTKPLPQKLAELGLTPADYISKAISKATGIERTFQSPEELASTPEGKKLGIATTIAAAAVGIGYLAAGATIRTILGLGGVGSLWQTGKIKSEKRQAMADLVSYTKGLPEQVKSGAITPETAFNELRLSAESTQTLLSQIKATSKYDISYYLSEGIQDQTQTRNNIKQMAGIAAEIAKASQQRTLSQQTLRNQQLINIKRQEQGQSEIKP